MRIGSLVYLDIMGKKCMGIIHSVDPDTPYYNKREISPEDYCWVLITSTGEKKWIKISKLSLV